MEVVSCGQGGYQRERVKRGPRSRGAACAASKRTTSGGGQTPEAEPDMRCCGCGEIREMQRKAKATAAGAERDHPPLE